MNTRTGEFPRFSKPIASPYSDLLRFAPEAAIAAVIVMTFVSAAWRGYNALSEHRSATRPAVAAPAAIIASVDRRLSHNKRYAAEVVVASPFVTGATQAWTVHVAKRNHQPIANAKISADVWLPDIGEHSLARPDVRYVGDGNYRIENFSFPRPGWWNVALIINGSAGVDSVAFNVIFPPVHSISSEAKP